MSYRVIVTGVSGREAYLARPKGGSNPAEPKFVETETERAAARFRSEDGARAAALAYGATLAPVCARQMSFRVEEVATFGFPPEKETP